MLKRLLWWEIQIFTDFKIDWAIFVVAGLLIGALLRLLAVRRKDEAKDTFIAILTMWALTHIVSFMMVSVGTPQVNTLLITIVSSLAPALTFAIIGYLIVHIYKKFNDNI